MKNSTKATEAPKFPSLFANPIFEADHEHLALNASGDQIEEVAQILDQHLPVAAEDHRLARAAVARSLVAAHKRGHRTRYSRSKTWYDGRPDRYKSAPGLESHWQVTRSMDALERWGFSEQVRGYHRLNGSGRQTTAWPTPPLLALIEHLIPAGEPVHPEVSETIVLRDANKDEIDYKDTADTRRMRNQLARINQATQELDIVDTEGNRVTIPPYRRIFNGGFDRGGRLYAAGPSYQNAPKAYRRSLRIWFRGQYEELVEVDFANLHLVMAYEEAGAPIPAGDLYRIKGFDRTLVKIAANVAMNAETTTAATKAISQALMDDPELRAASGITAANRKLTNALAVKVLVAFGQKHPNLKKVMCTDRGARYQKVDSDVVTRTTLALHRSTGTIPLIEHDSLLAPKSLTAQLISIMRRESTRTTRKGFRAALTVNMPDREGKPTLFTHTNHHTTPSPLKGTRADLGKQVYKNGPQGPKSLDLRASERPRCRDGDPRINKAGP